MINKKLLEPQISERKKVLFATIYHYESIINSLKELQNVENLVLFVDREDDIQKNSFEVIEKVSNLSKIKIQKEKFDVCDFSQMFKKLDEIVKKFQDFDIYVDISHSVRIKAIALINYFSIRYPSNFKRMTFYASWIPEIIEIPIFKAEKLNDIELKCIKYISKNKIFMINDLAKHLDCSQTHVYRVLGKLQEEQYIIKEERYELALKGKIVNN